MRKARPLNIGLPDIATIKVTARMRKAAMGRAEKKLDYTYNRYNYRREMRLNKLFIGELAEEATKKFIDRLGLQHICYNEKRTDEFKKDDPFDFKFGDIRVDLKSSKDNREHGILEILEKQNLVVPIDQSIKDIIIQAFVEKSEKQVWIACWATRKDLEKKENIGYLHWQPGQYYLLRIQKCRKMQDLKNYLVSVGAKTKH